MNERIKERYLLWFRLNERDYSPDQAKKKNADIRKIVMTDGPEEKRIAIKAAWKEHFGVEE
jgi:hypothetical protein